MRQTYPERFTKVLASNNLSEKERSFIESCQNFYSRKSRLTAGQAKWFKKIESQVALLDDGKELGDPSLSKELQKIIELSEPSSWARGFTESLLKQNKMGRTLSEKQLSTFEKIKKDFSPEAIKEKNKWVEEYDEEKKQVAKICAEYYKRQGYYFADLSNKILSDDSFIPSQKQWEKLTQNKYAKKVVDSSKISEAKYSKNDCVQLRKTSIHYKHNKKLRDKPGFIIKTNSSNPEAIKGGRYYDILFAGELKIYKILEKDLKIVK